MGNFFRALVSGNESEVHSVVVAGLVSLAVLVAITIYVVAQDHASWNPISYATGVGSLIAAMAGGKTVHDRLSSPPAREPEDTPK